MHIDIHIPRPGTFLLGLAAIAGWGVILFGSSDTPDVASQAPAPSYVASVIPAPPVQPVAPPLPAPIGGPDETEHIDALPSVVASRAISSRAQVSPALAAKISEAESRALEARAAQQLLREREEVIRYELQVLKEQREALGDTVDEALEEEFRRSTRLLLTLLQDERKAEQFLLTSLHQIWEANGKGVSLASGGLAEGTNIVLAWPVDPLLGISAGFLDEHYEQRFKFKHYGIDLPVDQGTVVHAAASGVIKDVVDHGLGFNYITIEHPGGYATLYGHLSKLTVKPGQFVAAGDALGFSGGMPGTPGAGFSTGPHVHFGLYVDGKAVDATPYLPPVSD